MAVHGQGRPGSPGAAGARHGHGLPRRGRRYKKEWTDTLSAQPALREAAERVRQWRSLLSGNPKPNSSRVMTGYCATYGHLGSRRMDTVELDLLDQLYDAVLDPKQLGNRITVGDVREWHRRWLGNVFWREGTAWPTRQGGFPICSRCAGSATMDEFDRPGALHPVRGAERGRTR